MDKKKIELIELLSQRFSDYSRKELYSMIMCGEIQVDGETIRNTRQKINQDSILNLKAKKWVSRGGEKLEHAITCWNISVEGKIVLDAGASTGGFTDCLLSHGASAVHAVDVGYNQLDYKLRTDGRVHVLERTNIMSVEKLDPLPDFAVADLSFRSIKGAAAHILGLTGGNMLIALIKPQFEVEASEVTGFDGVIRDERLLNKVLKETAYALEEENILIIEILKSPIKGGKGNTEFLFRLKTAESNQKVNNQAVLNTFLNLN